MDKRIFIEKRDNFDWESQNLFSELKLIYPLITSLKVYLIYDLFTISEQDFQKSLFNVFVDKVTDILHINNPAKNTHFAVEYLPGQYDQRADSAQQLIAVLTGNTSCVVRTAKLYDIQGIEDISSIKKYLINSVDSKEKDLNILINTKSEKPISIKKYEGFMNFNDSQLTEFYKQQGLAFDLDDLKFIQKHFSQIQRDPTETELKVLDTYWSDHCRHTTFMTELTDIRFEGNFKETLEKIFSQYLKLRKELNREHKPINLMDLATIVGKYFRQTGKLKDLIVSDEINACTIEVNVDVNGKEEPWYLLFKNETHNHPTEIEPFGGASTCIGGAIRDPLSGRAFVYQAMRVTGAGNPLESFDKTLPNKLPQRKIVQKAADGFSSYGNQIGLATTHISEIYDEDYKAKRMEVGMVVGAVPQDWVRREKPIEGDKVIVLGGKTGRDGIGGATGSSKVHDEKSIHTMSAEVQKGDAVQERKIQRFFRNKKVIQLIKKCNDFGAGGVSVAIGELAEGLEINLDVLPTKYEGLNGTELAISESQERMAVVVDPKDVNTFIELAEKENILAVEVAKVTSDKTLKMYWKGNKIVDLSRDFLDTHGSAKTQEAHVKIKNQLFQNKKILLTQDYLKKELSSLEHCSQKGLIEKFDNSVGRSTVLMPLGGKNQLTPAEGSVQTLPIQKGKTNTVSLATWGFSPQIAKNSPLHGGAYAVVESVAKVVALGGDYKKIRFSFQEYFERLGTDPEKWGKPLSALLGAIQAQLAFECAAIGGKDSMSGTFKELNVPPTLISFACAIGDKNHIISPELKEKNNRIYLFKHLPLEDEMPNYTQLKKIYSWIHEQILHKKIVSVKTIKNSHPAVELAKMSIGNDLGVEVDIENEIYTIGSLLFESTEKLIYPEIYEIGKVIHEPILKINSQNFILDELKNSFKDTLEPIFATEIPIIKQIQKYNIPKKEPKNNPFIKKNIEKPKVVIPVFPGTNCEYESIKAFEEEGAGVTSVLINNLNLTKLNNSIQVFEKELQNTQILMLPGGFSAGDEPDGSAKFMVSILKNEKIKTQVHDLLQRGGLILGICNGFQALVKSGLLPYGKIQDSEIYFPTLTHNKIGRHVSQMVTVKVVSDRSPWLKGMKDATYTIPVSHGEGCFYADEKNIKELIKYDQIATQYVDFQGNPSINMPHNPNGSVYAIEGLVSKCGQIYGRMGHPERFEDGLMINIPGTRYHNIFKKAVDYFKQSI
ncbi:phosphoribosylformylglycinamidine synthase [Apibacter adventoris]|uniref:phosphoribosylformylglycinamidine synthase n=1 Tax=Apibacter adventoris TaxID=1679466 RepID=UPI000CF5F2EC|nr:phosphoribosylformylglycinamidine synthase [Apibacter adventoris]PQL95169.1 phosphoribosylformylglycinamidine synthase [Apibacter adventoris]